MRIRYNAPVTLTFALICTLVLASDQLLGTHLIPNFFTVPPRQDFSFGSALDIVRLFTYVIGHAGWPHLLGNLSFILLLGPILEEKHGSLPLLLMMTITALVTGLINALFLSTGLLGASGIAFMMILLVGFTNMRSGDIPLTFVLIVALYITQQVVASFHQDNIAEFAHIAGGACGSVFGFLRAPRKSVSKA